METNKHLIRFGLAVLAFWFLTNAYNYLVGNKPISLEKALFVVIAIFVGSIAIRLVIDFIKVYWNAIKDGLKSDKE